MPEHDKMLTVFEVENGYVLQDNDGREWVAQDTGKAQLILGHYLLGEYDD